MQAVGRRLRGTHKFVRIGLGTFRSEFCWRLFRLVDAAESFRTRRQSRFIQEGCRGGRRTALCVMPRRYIRGNEGGGASCRPARGIRGQGAARLQVKRASRWRRGGDGGCRRFPERRGNCRTRALSGTSLGFTFPQRIPDSKDIRA